MKELYDDISARCSKIITRKYSTSFSLGIYFLHKSLHEAIYAIYGFVRLADEIVDSFHGYNQEYLAEKFRADTVEAIEQHISINPVLNSFQQTIREYSIDWELIDTFLNSMEMDLRQIQHNEASYQQYILGSAEVVGLMCLKVFVQGSEAAYLELKPFAMKLGAAFQKVNFLRDIQADYSLLGRTYFPGVDFAKFSAADKAAIERDIEHDFDEALNGIRKLPPSSKAGVYLAYYYYKKLFVKIKKTPAEKIVSARIRIDNFYKLWLMLESLIRVRFNAL